MRFLGWMVFLKVGRMDFDGWMDGCFFGATAQGIWYDQYGNAAQVSGLGGGLSGYVPSTEPLPASYVASDRYKENERLKKEIRERIQREREEKNQKRYEDLKKKISERRQAEAKAESKSSEPKAKAKSKSSEPKAKGSEPSEPKAKGSEPVSKATSSAPQPKVPTVKQMPNPFMSYEYCAEHSSVTIEEVPDENQLAIPVPKRHQQYASWNAAMKRFKKQ